MRGERKPGSHQAEGATVVFVAIDNKLAAILAITDPIKQSTPAALKTLHELGLKVVMLTGDAEPTAKAVATKLGIDEFHAGVSPEEKHDFVRKLKKEGKTVAMCGDGINDAPALAEANVGIAMGTGTGVAIESAGVTLVGGDLRGVAAAANLSRKTMSNIRQNLFFAFIYNALGIPVAAGLLYPVFGVLLSPMIAAAAMSFSSVSVIANALRLRAARSATVRIRLRSITQARFQSLHECFWTTRKRKLNNRLRRVIGQVEAVGRMIVDEEYCVDILMQLSAATGALSKIGQIVLEQHIKTCVSDAMESGEANTCEDELGVGESGRAIFPTPFTPPLLHSPTPSLPHSFP